MADLILVLNAGSSSLKFRGYTVEADDGGALPLLVRGQVESLYTEPRFTVSNAAGDRHEEHSWRSGTQLGTTARSPGPPISCAATAKASGWSRPGIASCTAGCASPARPWSRRPWSRNWRPWCRWRRCTSRTTWRRSAPWRRCGRTCPRSPASTPPFTAPSRKKRKPLRCRSTSPRARHHRARRAPLRLSWPLLRVHREPPA